MTTSNVRQTQFQPVVLNCSQLPHTIGQEQQHAERATANWVIQLQTSANSASTRALQNIIGDRPIELVENRKSTVGPAHIESRQGKLCILFPSHGDAYSLSQILCLPNGSFRQIFLRSSLCAIADAIWEYPELFPGQLNPEGILFECSGEELSGLIFVPESWQQVMTANTDHESSKAGELRMNHPDARGLETRRALYYVLASLICVSYGACWPYEGESDGQSDMEEYQLRQRRGLHLPPNCILPGLSDKQISLLDNALRLCLEPSSHISESFKHLISTLDPSIEENADFQDGPPAQTKLWRRYQQRNKRFLVQRFLRKRRSQLFIAAGALIAIGFLASFFITSQTRPLAVSGLDSREVVLRFYGSYETLDHQFMADASKGPSPRKESRSVAELYAYQRYREGVEGPISSEVETPMPGVEAEILHISAISSPEDMVQTLEGWGERIEAHLDDEIRAYFEDQGNSKRERSCYLLSYNLHETGYPPEHNIDVVMLEQFPRGWRIRNMYHLLEQ